MTSLPFLIYIFLTFQRTFWHNMHYALWSYMSLQDFDFIFGNRIWCACVCVSLLHSNFFLILWGILMFFVNLGKVCAVSNLKGFCQTLGVVNSCQISKLCHFWCLFLFPLFSILPLSSFFYSFLVVFFLFFFFYRRYCCRWSKPFQSIHSVAGC